MLNADVILVIRSFAGTTALDVADAVRELKREGVAVAGFRMGALSKLCFFLKHRFAPQPRASSRWALVYLEYTHPFMDADCSVYLLAFKLLGYAYDYGDCILPVQRNANHAPHFRIAARQLDRVEWYGQLLRLHEAECGPGTFSWARGKVSHQDELRATHRVIRPLF